LNNIEYKVRKAGYSDIFDHLKKCDDSFSPPLSSYVNIEEYSKKIHTNAVTFEAWEDGELVGLVACYLNDQESRQGYITDVSVLETHSGRGIGKRLLEGCEEYARRSGTRSIALEVNVKNTGAISLYEKTGFRLARPGSEKLGMKKYLHERTPLVSICCVTYNHAKYIRETLEGFMMQQATFPFEVLVHDDASTDGTADIVKEFEEKYPDVIKPVYQEINQHSKGVGISASFNFPRASGEYIAMCEGDDRWTNPMKLQRQVEFLEANPDYAICFHNAVVEFDDPEKKGCLYSDFPWNGIDRKRDVYTISDLIASPLCPTASVVFRRPPDMELPAWFPKVPSGDMALSMLICGDKKIKYFDENWAVYRKHASGVTVNHKGDYIHAGRIYMYLRILEHYMGKHIDDIKKMIGHHLENLVDLSSLEDSDRLTLRNLLPEYFNDRKTFVEHKDNTPLKVTFAAYGPNQFNGPNIWLQRILPELALRGIKPEVIFLMNSGAECAVADNLRSKGIECVLLPRMQYTEQNIQLILNALKKNPPDVFVPNLNVPAYYASRWVKEAGIPTIGILHSDDNFHHELIEYFVAGPREFRLSGIACVSEYIESIVKKEDIPEVDVLKCSYGIDLPEGTAEYLPDRLNLIYTGRLIQRQKRIFDVIESLKNAVDSIPGTYATLYGEDREQGKAIAAITDCRRGDRLKYGGLLSLDEIFPTLQRNHVFVLLSDYEGMSISLMEAMGCGLVPICTKTKSGATEIIRHDENGLLVDDRKEDFLDAVGRLKNEKGLWQRLSGAARETVEKEYTIRKCAYKWAGFLKKMAAKSPARSEIKVPASNGMTLPQIKVTENGLAREDNRMPPESSAVNNTNLPDWRGVALPEAAGNITTMLSLEERRLLYALGKDYWKGTGAIVDAGCFLGGSTLPLAMGALENGNKASKYKVVHSYDLFRADKHQSDTYLKKHGSYSPGESTRPIFDKNTKDIKYVIDVHEGDITSFPWNGKDVELLFIDVTKSWKINDFIVREFFPCLIPGHSLVIQQDIVHPTCPWLAVTMEYFSGFFEPVEYVPGNTIVFLLKKKLPHSMVVNDTISCLPDKEKLRLMGNAIEKCRAYLKKEDLVELECARAVLEVSLLGAEEAKRSLIGIWKEYKGFKRTVEAVKWVEKSISGQESKTARKDDFIDIDLAPDNIDLYYARTSIKNAVDKYKDRFKGTLLDLGCGEMPYREYLLSNSAISKYIGMDIPNPTYQQNRMPDLFWDGTKIPLEDASVDCVMATEFFEHVPSPETILAEVRRILKPEGILFFTVPFLWPLHTMPFDEYRHTPFSLERIFRNSGFHEVDIQALGGWDASLAQMIGLWVKRRPMSEQSRKDFSGTLFPFYRDLLKFESQGHPPTYEEMSKDSMMITGLTGIARKPASGDEKAKLSNAVLAIVCPQVGAPSETFIRKHIELLMPGRTVILTGNVSDQSWFKGPMKIIPIRLGAYSFDKEQEEDVTKFLKEHSVTHILCEYGCLGGALVELNNKKLHLPIYVHFHGQDASEYIRRPEIAGYYKWMGKVVNGVVAVSKPMAERLIQVGIPKDKIKIIHYGVSHDAECKVPHEKNPCRFLSVSRLVGKKGIPYVLQAFEKTIKAFPDATLDLIGEGLLRKEIEKFIDEHDLGRSVRLHGEQPHKYVLEMMDRSSIFVQHSVVDPDTGNAEGLPLSILEASSHGLPVISTFHEGIPEAIEHERTGFLVDERDWESMAGFMMKLASDGALRKKLGVAGREKIANGGFTVEAMTGKLRGFTGLDPSHGTGADLAPKRQNNVTRVLFVNHSIYPLETSGTPLSTRNHALGMARRGLEVAALIPRLGMKAGYGKEQSADGITIYLVPSIEKYSAFFAGPGQSGLSDYRQAIEQVIEDFQPQVVHINDYSLMPAEIMEIFSRRGCIVVREVCNFEELCHRDCPVVSSGLEGRLCSGPESSRKCADCISTLPETVDRGSITGMHPKDLEGITEQRFIHIKNLYRDAVDKVLFTSRPFKEYFTRFVSLPEEKIRVIPRGFDFDFPRHPEQGKTRDGVIHFGLVGHVIFSKGADVALHAFEKICDGNNFVFHVYGTIANPEYADWLNRLESRHPGRFIYHGPYGEKDLPAIASRIDVCIIPSYFDTYNRVVREFLYLGIPVIATDFFGAYIVQDGINGFRIPVGDADALAGKMLDLVRRPDRIDDLARGAAQTEIPTLEDEIDQLIETYDELLEKKGAAPGVGTYRAIAFYLPQYHPIPENDKWWGKGFTEWTNVKKARPLFPGHHQPQLPADLGFYDLRLPETREAQAGLAGKYGIDGFCYWHYWFKGKRLLDLPFRSVLESGKPDFPFCLAWANETWSRRWLGEEKDVLMKQEYSEEDDRDHALWLVSAFKDKRYIKVGDRPLFLIYRPKDLPDPERTVQILRMACSQNGLADPYLVGMDAHCMDTDCRTLGFDETLNFMPQLSYLPEFMNDEASESKQRRNAAFGVDSAKLKVYGYEEAMDAMLSGLKKIKHPVIPSLFVGWDNTPRRGENGIIVKDASPRKFGHALQSLVDSVQNKPAQQRFVFLNAWNEWAEGNHLEPDLQNGHEFLEEVRKTKSGGKTGCEASKIRSIAFYLPQFHPIPENDAWWGKGFTEWTNVKKAEPIFPGHYQPHLPGELGYYDLRLPEIRKAQAELARKHGIHGFCYYHYWFNGKLLLDYPLRQVLDSGEPDFPFCLCWANENWTRAWDGKESDILISQDYTPEDDLMHIRHLLGIFKDRRYIRIDGKPLFIVYRASNLPDPLKTTSMWRDEARKTGLGELFLCRVERFLEDMTDPRPLGFDAAIEFQPDGFNLGKPLQDPDYAGHSVYEYKDLVKAALSKREPAYLRFPCVSPGWDNSPRRKKNAIIFRRSDPKFYELWLEKLVERAARRRPEERVIFINAFNEWGEGCHLEPDRKSGDAYLEATRRALGSFKPDTALTVSIVIPVFNRVEYTRQCLEALAENTPADLFEVIIVDNGSTDGTKEFLSCLGGDVTVITNETNLGFAKACNQGIEKAKGEHVLLLNNDAVVTGGWLDRLLSHLDPDTGMVGPMSNGASGPQQVREVPYGENMGELPVIMGLGGFCLLVRKKVLDIAGGLDERFVNGNFGIDDLCLRSFIAGYRNVIAKDAFVHHYGGTASGSEGVDPLALKADLRRFADKWKDLVRIDGNGCKVSMTGEQQARKLIEWGEEKFSQGDFPAAMKIFERVLALDRTNSRALADLAKAATRTESR